MRNYIENYCVENELDNVMFMDGHDNAILGLSSCFHSIKVVYSYKKIIKNLCKYMTYDEAVEYYSYNIQGAYVGEGTPIIMQDDIDWKFYE